MAYYRRKRFTRQTRFRRRRYGYRPRKGKFTRAGVARRQRMGQLRHYFKRSVTYTIPLDTSSSNPQFSASNFQLANLPSYTEFSALFDNYKIHAVKMDFFRPAIALGYGIGPKLFLHTAVDYDDGNPPSNVTDLEQRPSYKVVDLGSIFSQKAKVTRYLKPKFLRMLYESGTTTGYQPSRAGIVDMADPTVPHYGLKWALQVIDEQGVSGTMPFAFALQISVTYYLSLGGVR